MPENSQPAPPSVPPPVPSPAAQADERRAAECLGHLRAAMLRSRQEFETTFERIVAEHLGGGALRDEGGGEAMAGEAERPGPDDSGSTAALLARLGAMEAQLAELRQRLPSGGMA